LTPQVTALWRHPLFGGGGVYVGTGGLELFQADLDGSITANFGVSVSGSATCLLTLPTFTKAVPAGNLGAVIIQIVPTITFHTTGKIDLQTTATFGCGAEYRWDQGQESSVAYCRHTVTPLQLSADTGIDATLSGNLNTTVTLDGIAGIYGNPTAGLHASYTPTGHPVAQLEGTVSADLGACLACLWGNSPARHLFLSKTFFNKTLATYDTAPPPVDNGPPVITSTTLPNATLGQPYTTTLTTADNRNGTWSITTGTLPAGLTLTGNTITGTPTLGCVVPIGQ